MRDESKMHFWLSLNGENIDPHKIERSLGIRPDDNRISAPDDLPSDPDCPVFYKEIEWLLDIAENNREKLIDAGVVFSGSQIWVIYYYDKQCNMEFDPALLERMGRIGLKLCISCEGLE